ncbi:hypothetical protein [Sporobacter termitidis]|uniref:hypothetical protein n=1 Tax=Sporobacter termitidis TaxID=44749 RepID=UPI001160829F|nr:hypothetical protein [Sporobacter termitidis]
MIADLIIDENMYGHASGKNKSIPVHIEHYFFKENGSIFPPHWHEQFMLMYVKQGVLLLLGNQPDLQVLSFILKFFNIYDMLPHNGMYPY